LVLLVRLECQPAGSPPLELPEQLAVMDIRLLVREMMSNAKSPWQLIHFVNAPESIALAEELGAGVAASEA